MRYVLIDRLVELEPGRRVVAERRFPPGEELFADHFPGLPVVPGALLTESMAQAGGWLIAATLDFRRWPILAMIDGAKFRSLVRPGDRIRVEAELHARRQEVFEIQAEASVDERRVASARLLFHVLDPDESAAAETFRAWTRSTFRAIGGEDLLGKPAG